MIARLKYQYKFIYGNSAYLFKFKKIVTKTNDTLLDNENGCDHFYTTTFAIKTSGKMLFFF